MYINAERIVKNLYGIISINFKLLRYKIHDYKDILLQKLTTKYM